MGETAGMESGRIARKNPCADEGSIAVRSGAQQPGRNPLDVLVFLILLFAYIWIVKPLFGGSSAISWLVKIVAMGIAIRGVVRLRGGRRQAGLRLDNLGSSLAVYLLASAVYATLVMLVLWNYTSFDEVSWPSLRALLWRIVWAFLQQFYLLSFLFSRLREILGKDAWAVPAATAIFALCHLPNPFLTLYTLGGGLIATTLFLRYRNVFAAALAHALASLLVSRFLVDAVTGGLRVGPGY